MSQEGSDFESLYRQHSQPLLAFLLARVQPRTDAEDVAQQVWQRVFEHRDQFTGGNFRAWLFQIARNAVVDHGRRQRPGILPIREDVAAGGHAEPLAGLLEQERRTALERCLKELRSQEYELVVGRLRGEAFPELSARLGMTPKQAHRLFHTAKTRLQECVDREE